MKKLLTLILLVASSGVMAQNWTWYREEYTNAPPTGNPNSPAPQTSYIRTDTAAVKGYTYEGNGVWRYRPGLTKGTKGDTGPQGIQGIQGVKGDVGATGPQGIPGSGGGNSIYITPDMFGAVHANHPLTAGELPQFAGTGAVTGDQKDWAAWQMAVNASATSKQPIEGYGSYYINRAITIAKTTYTLDIDCHWCKLIATNNGTWSFIYRTYPSDNGDANQMIQATAYNIEKIVFIGQGNQTGIDIPATYNAEYTKTRGEGVKKVINLRFGLGTLVSNSMATQTTDAWVADMGNWSGASNSNSQSNHSTFDHCRSFNSTNTSFGIYAASGVAITNGIIEGNTSVVTGIDFNDLGSTVVHDLTIQNVHFEATGGASEAFIKARNRTAIITVDKCFGQYASIFADARSSSGLGLMHILHVPYWVPKNGKMFVSEQCSWQLDYNNFARGSELSSMYNYIGAIPNPQLCNGGAGGAGCGYGIISFKDIGR